MASAAKIIFTVTNDLTYDQRMNRICTSLSTAGFEVVLVGRKHKDSQALDTKVFEQKRLKCFINKGKFFYVEYNIRLFFYLLFSKFDGICAIDLDTILPAYFVSKFKRKICVYDAHEFFTEVPEVIERPKVKKAWEMIANLTIPNIKYCYTVGPALAKLFSQKYKTPFEVIMNPPVLEHFDQKEKENKTILYQGALNKSRGLEHYIEMMQWVNATLWIIGEGDLSKKLRNMAKEFQVENKVIFWGFKKPSEMKEFTQRATIGLNVSENAGLSYFYSLNNKFFDYIHALLPSVTNGFPEYEAMNEKWNVMIFANANARSVADAVNELLTNQNLYQHLENECKKACIELTWENEEKKLIHFYKEIFE